MHEQAAEAVAAMLPVGRPAHCRRASCGRTQLPHRSDHNSPLLAPGPHDVGQHLGHETVDTRKRSIRDPAQRRFRLNVVTIDEIVPAVRDHGVDALARCLQMKLQTDDVRAELERLIFACRAASQPDRALRQVERLTMPVKDGFPARKLEAICGRRARLDVEPTYLLMMAGVNTGSQCTGNELRPKADSDDRQSLSNCFTNELFLALEPWQEVSSFTLIGPPMAMTRSRVVVGGRTDDS